MIDNYNLDLELLDEIYNITYNQLLDFKLKIIQTSTIVCLQVGNIHIHKLI